MTLQIQHTASTVTVIKDSPTVGRSAVSLGRHNQRELLEALARIHGFTLIDREEREELLTLIEEVDVMHDDASTSDTGGWEQLCKALAAAVNSALFVEGGDDHPAWLAQLISDQTPKEA